MEGSLINCKNCGILFIRKKNRILCDSCFNLEREQIEKLANFADTCEEPVTMRTISEETGIDIETINDLYKSNKLLSFVTSKIIINCKICKNEFKGSGMKGYFCDKCFEHMAEEGGITQLDGLNNKVELKSSVKDNTKSNHGRR